LAGDRLFVLCRLKEGIPQDGPIALGNPQEITEQHRVVAAYGMIQVQHVLVQLSGLDKSLCSLG
jgi:hypothetical protein